MNLKFAFGMIAVASLMTGCRGTGTQSTEEGVAFTAERAVSSSYYDIGNYLNDPQLRSIANQTGSIQTWFVPKVFGGENGEMHVCVYVNNESRPSNYYDNADTSSLDLERFSRARVLKGGKYINWSTLFQVLNNQKNSGEWNPKIQQTFSLASDMLKDEKEKLKRSLETNLEDMRVIQPQRVAGLFSDYYANSDERTKPESILAGLLLTLDRTPATGNDCPSAANLADKARGNPNVVIVQPAPPVQIKIPSCSGDQALVNHNRGNGWVCEGSGAYTKYGKNCKDSGNGYFRENAQGDIADRNTWKCMKP